MDKYQINHLKELEAESIFVIREVAAQFENPVMLFSGGKILLSCFIWPERLFGLLRCHSR